MGRKQKRMMDDQAFTGVPDIGPTANVLYYFYLGCFIYAAVLVVLCAVFGFAAVFVIYSEQPSNVP